MKFLTNAPRRKKRTSRFKKGSAAAKAYMKSIRPKSKGGSSVAERRRKVTRKRTTKAVTKRRRTRSNPHTAVVRRRRPSARRYRRNPGLSFGYFSVRTLMNGAIDGAEVVVGKSLVRTIPQMIGLPTGDQMGLLVQAISAVVVGWAGHSFISPNAGKMFLAGGLAAPMETLIKQLNIPFISAGLGDDTVEIESMGAYPQITNALSAYPQYGEVEDNQEAYSQQ